MDEVAVIDSPAVAAAALEPTRARVLAELAEPGSASTLAERLGLPRQKLNYHVRALEAQGLVELVEVRSRRGCTERIMQASAAAYVLSPDALGPAAADPARTADRLSAGYLLALGARAIREVGTLRKSADAAGKALPTLSIDTEIRFRSAAERGAFTRDLAEAVATLAARYHDENAPGGRWSRLVVLAHPPPGVRRVRHASTSRQGGDMTEDSRSIELEVEVPGTPEEVWAAVATGPGIGSWFVPGTVEEREGGETVQHFGPGDAMTVRGRVRVWDPPRRVVFDGGEDGAGMAFEWLVEARDGGTCVVRLVHSGFGSGEEWNDQFDAMEAGWRMFLHNLYLHRRYFPGQVGLAVQPLGMAAVGLDEAWDTLTAALGIPAASAAGDQLAAGPDAPTALAGTVERVVPRMLSLRIDEPGPGTAVVAVEGTDGQAAISVWFWLYGADARDRAPAVLEGWQGWLADLFPMPG